MKGFLPSQMQTLLVVFFFFLLPFQSALLHLDPRYLFLQFSKLLRNWGKLYFWMDFCTERSWGKAGVCLLPWPRLGAGVTCHPSPVTHCSAIPYIP